MSPRSLSMDADAMEMVQSIIVLIAFDFYLLARFFFALKLNFRFSLSLFSLYFFFSVFFPLLINVYMWCACR